MLKKCNADVHLSSLVNEIYEEGRERSVTPMGDCSDPRRNLKRRRPPPEASTNRDEPSPDTLPDTSGAGIPTATVDKPSTRPRYDGVNTGRHIKKRGEPSLPWSPDRFYINELPSLQGREGSPQGRYCGSHRGDAGNDDGGSRRGGEGGDEEAGKGKEGHNFFSLKRLLEVVTGNGWPGLKGVILGTFSLDMRRLAEECPALMKTSTLILHGDRSLRRRTNRSGRPDRSVSPDGVSVGGASVGDAMKGRGKYQSEGNCLLKGGISGDVSPERRRRMEEAGRHDRIVGWKMPLPAGVLVEKVKAVSRGVHHPKFGLLFLKDGSLVMYVGTANLGADTAIDATWVQRFGAKSQAAKAEMRPLDETGRSDGLEGTADEDIWEGDFAETLQDFLEQESRLMLRGEEKERVRPNTPVEFMRRVLGIEHVGESFDFSAALVDLIPTVPIDTTVEVGDMRWSGKSMLCHSTSLPPRGRGRHDCNDSDTLLGGRSGADGHERGPPRYYGQLRVRHVLNRRRRQAGELGPSDLLIVQPTSFGPGIDHAFMEVFAASCMPDSVEPCHEAWRHHLESRLESSRIVWPSGQYIDACRSDMSKSPCLKDRQVATVMEVSRQYVLGESEKDATKVNCGFLFMTPRILESMGVDLRDCLRTFHLHPAFGLPLRPAHIKSAMRLRPPPPPPLLEHPLPRDGDGRDVGREAWKGSPRWRGDDRDRQNKCGASLTKYRGVLNSGGGEQRGDVPCPLDEEGRGPCEHAQHLAWFLLTSACLSQGAQGVVRHTPKTGVPVGVNCRNVELGVLFHSTPSRAYYVEPVPGCDCRSVPDLEVRTSTVAMEREGMEGDTPRRRNTPLLHIPLPVPFRLDSEPYSNPAAGSPDLRFLPYMHILKEFPRPAEVESLLKSNITEAQFA